MHIFFVHFLQHIFNSILYLNKKTKTKKNNPTRSKLINRSINQYCLILISSITFSRLAKDKDGSNTGLVPLYIDLIWIEIRIKSKWNDFFFISNSFIHCLRLCMACRFIHSSFMQQTAQNKKIKLLKHLPETSEIYFPSVV